MKRILLTNSKRTAIVEDKDFERISPHSCYLSSNGKAIFIYVYGKYMTLGKFILMPKESNLVVDHRNHNIFDFRHSNIRVVPRGHNDQNRIKKANCSSKYQGVSWNKKVNKWEARLKFERKSIYLGSFLIEEDAARAYNRAALCYYGSGARLNEIAT